MGHWEVARKLEEHPYIMKVDLSPEFLFAIQDSLFVPGSRTEGKEDGRFYGPLPA